jgi:MFS family permease
MGQLIVFRAIQGIGAGSMQTMALTVVGDIFDLKERAKMQGVFGAAWGFFGLTGPMLGGYIVHALGWRWVFYINLPFGLIATVLLVTSLFERVEKKPHKLDFLGALLLTVTVIALLLATGRSGATITVAAAIATLVFLAAFLAVERAAKEPVIPLPLFTRKVMLLSSIIGAIIGGAMISIVTYVPLFVQSVLHGTPTEAGSAITPMLVTWPISSALAGRMIPRVGFRPLIWVGLACTLAAALALALFGTHDDLTMLGLTSAAFGLGMGFANTAVVIVVQTSVNWNERGIATASTMFFRTIGGVIAVGVIGGVITAALLRDPTLTEEAVNKLLSREGLRDLDPDVLARVSGALEHAFGTVFWIIAGISGAAFVASLWFPSVPTSQEVEVKTGEGKPLGAPEPAPPPGH